MSTLPPRFSNWPVMLLETTRNHVSFLVTFNSLSEYVSPFWPLTLYFTNTFSIFHSDQNDEELNRLLGHVVISQGGVLPHSKFRTLCAMRFNLDAWFWPSFSLRSFQFTESSCLQSQKRQLLKLVKHHKKFEICSIQHSCISRRPIYQFHLLSGRLTFLLFSLHVSLWSFPYRNRVLLVFDCDWCLLFVLFPLSCGSLLTPKKEKKNIPSCCSFFSLFLLA